MSEIIGTIPDKMYGAMHYNPTDEQGNRAMDWCRKNSAGAFKTTYINESRVMVFYDVKARDAFLKIFGGLSVTLEKSKESVITGVDAMEAINSFNLQRQVAN